MDKTINQYINQLHLDPKREAAVRKLIQSVSQSSGSSNGGSSGGSNTPEPEFVDLGLPSGTLWCSCNLGANSPEEPGNYYMWGDHTPYSADLSDVINTGYKLINEAGDIIDYSNAIEYYKYADRGDESTDWKNKLYKYNGSSDKGVVDHLTTLTMADDTAYKYNKEWRVPSPNQIQELINFTTQELIKKEDDLYIFKLTSNINNNYIYIPYMSSVTPTIIMSNSLSEWGSDYEKYEVILAGAINYMSGDNLVLTNSISYGTFFKWGTYTIRPVKFGNTNKDYIEINLQNLFSSGSGNLRRAYITYSALMNAYITNKPVYDSYSKSFLTYIQKDDSDVISAYVNMIGDYQSGDTNNLLVQLIHANPDGTLEFVSAPA